METGAAHGASRPGLPPARPGVWGPCARLCQAGPTGVPQAARALLCGP